MSIRPLLQPDSINNKTLNLYYNNAEINNFIVDNLTVKTGDNNNLNYSTPDLGSNEYVLRTDGKGAVFFGPDTAGAAGVIYNGPPTATVGTLMMCNAPDGKAVTVSSVVESKTGVDFNSLNLTNVGLINDVDINVLEGDLIFQSGEISDLATDKLSRDGTLAMTGNLDLDTKNINNVGTLTCSDLTVFNVNGSAYPYIDNNKLSLDGTLAMTGNLNLDSKNINNVGTLTCSDLTVFNVNGSAYPYIDNNKLSRDGSLAMTGNLNLDSKNINNVGTLTCSDFTVYNVNGSVYPYIDNNKLSRDGTLAMTGNLNLDSKNINNVGTLTCSDLTVYNINGSTYPASDNFKLSRDGSLAMTGDLNLNTHNLINVGLINGTAYPPASDSTKLSRDGSLAMTGSLNMGSQNITSCNDIYCQVIQGKTFNGTQPTGTFGAGDSWTATFGNTIQDGTNWWGNRTDNKNELAWGYYDTGAVNMYNRMSLTTAGLLKPLTISTGNMTCSALTSTTIDTKNNTITTGTAGVTCGYLKVERGASTGTVADFGNTTQSRGSLRFRYEHVSNDTFANYMALQWQEGGGAWLDRIRINQSISMLNALYTTTIDTQNNTITTGTAGITCGSVTCSNGLTVNNAPYLTPIYTDTTNYATTGIYKFFGFNAPARAMVIGSSTDNRAMLFGINGGGAPDPDLFLSLDTLTGKIFVPKLDAKFDINTSANFQAQGTATINGGSDSIYLNNATRNNILFNANGLGLPTFTSRSVGTKIVISPGISPTSADYAIGMDTDLLWTSLKNSSGNFKWYGGTFESMSLTGGGALTAVSLTATADIKYNQFMFEVYSTGNATTTTPSATGTATRVLFGSVVSGMAAGFFIDTVTNKGQVRYDGTRSRMCHAGCTFSVKCGSPNQDLTFYIYHNGVLSPGSKVKLYLQATGTYQSTAIHKMMTLAPSDTLALYFENASSTTAITVEEFNMFGLCSTNY